jgi:hypothetical protein
MTKSMNHFVTRHVLAGIAYSFSQDILSQSCHYFTEDDLSLDDEVKLPEGKVVKVTIEYVNESEIDGSKTERCYD